jgi:uncharacterized iron-regulated protein
VKLLATLASLLAGAALAGPVEQRDVAGLGNMQADVVVIGEVHDNPAHHAHQAVLVAMFAPGALVFEMLTPDQAARIDDASDMAAMETALGWTAAGWPDFAMYHPIFLAAPDAKVFGAAVDADVIRRALGHGAAAAFGVGAARYGLDQPLSGSEQDVLEIEQRQAHCGALPEEMLGGMVEVQRLRDAALARAVVQAMKATGGPVIVITGNGHARRDRGVPAVLCK